MKIQLKKEVFSNFNPQLKVAFLLAENIDNTARLADSQHLLKEMEELIRLTFNKDSYKSHDLIKPWDLAKREFGEKAKHYHTNVERLLKTVLQRKTVHTSSVISNLINYLSLKHIIPISVDDLGKIQGDLTFSVSGGKERKVLLKRLKKGEIYYKDDKSILGAKLDYWKSSKTAVSRSTTSALIHLVMLPPVADKKMKEILEETKTLVSDFCGGRVKVFVLDKKKNSVSLKK